MDLMMGDHLKVSRGFYTHHGIYIGGGQVIHYSGLADGLQSGPVSKVTLKEFMGGSQVKKVVYKNPKYSGMKAVARAKSRLGENLYDVHSNNCEHFCCWAITGNHTSKQVGVVEAIVGRVSPTTEIVSNYRTYKTAHKTNDEEAIKSARNNLVATAGKTAGKAGALKAAAVVGTAVNPLATAAVGIGFLALKIYRKTKK